MNIVQGTRDRMSIARAKTMQMGVGGAVNWWEAGGATGCVAAYQAKGAASYAASKVNRANAGTNDLAESGGATTWSALTGWTFSGSTNFDTGLFWSATWTCLVRFSDDVGDGYTTGVYGGIDFWINPADPNDPTHVRYKSGTLTTVNPDIRSGVLAIAGRKCYRNGVHEATLGAATGTSTSPIAIGALYNTARYKGKLQALAYYNNTLSDAQVLAISTAMAAL